MIAQGNGRISLSGKLSLAPGFSPVWVVTKRLQPFQRLHAEARDPTGKNG
jgi:hypothetical protein